MECFQVAVRGEEISCKNHGVMENTEFFTMHYIGEVILLTAEDAEKRRVKKMIISLENREYNFINRFQSNHCNDLRASLRPLR